MPVVELQRERWRVCACRLLECKAGKCQWCSWNCPESEELSFQQRDHADTLAAPCFGHCWVLGTWPHVPSGCSCPSLCTAPACRGGHWSTAVCICHQLVSQRGVCRAILVLLHPSACVAVPSPWLSIFPAILGLGRESTAGWGMTSAVCKGGGRKAAADPEKLLLLLKWVCFLPGFLPILPSHGRSVTAHRTFPHCWGASNWLCYCLYLVVCVKHLEV